MPPAPDPDDGRLRGFPPVVPDRPRALVLGSMPSVASLEATRYYGHPRNAFWPIMTALFGWPDDLDYDRRVARLAAVGVALWDVIGTCRRDGSLDTAIRDPEVNDVAGLLRSRPTIRAVFLNGGTADTLFRRHVVRPHPELFEDVTVQRMPSTSPAHAARSFDQKLQAWRALAAAL